MLDKSNSRPSIAEIEFNWERVKKKASSKREELVNNSPNVVRRQVNTIADPLPPKYPNKESTTSTTDTITDPYTSIEIQSKKSSMETDLRANEPIQTTDNKPTTIDNSYIDNESNGTHNPQLGTQSTQLLPRPSPQGSITPSCEENLGPEANAVEIIKGIKAGELSGKELTVDERRLVVKSMKELGQTQDAIADLLKVSRRTIVNDYKALRQQQALAIQNTDTAEIAGEVYDVAKTCIRRALQAGSFRTVSVVMRDMVEVLQSLGILYRAPKTSMQASLHGRLPGHNTGYQKYIDGIGNDKGKVIEVLDCMFDAIDKDSI
jgi:predicted transcriptional regulator